MYHPHFRSEQARLVIRALAHLASEKPRLKEQCEEVVSACSSAVLDEQFKQELQFWDNLRRANKITWKCHICGKEREDSYISVYHRDISEKFGFAPGTLGENVRHCNDNEECCRKAPEYHHIR